MDILPLIVVFVALALLAGFLILLYIRLHANKHRYFSMVFLKVQIPRKEGKDDRESEKDQFSTGKDFKEIVGVMSQFYEALNSIFEEDFKYHFIGQDFFSCEYAVIDEQVYQYIVAPRELVPLIEKQLTSFYPDCYIEEVEDYNIFKPGAKVASCYMKLVKNSIFPIRTHQRMNQDPLNGILNVLSKLSKNEGAAIQIIMRPIADGWQDKGRKTAEDIFAHKAEFTWWNPLSWFGTLFRLTVHGVEGENFSENWDTNKGATRTTPLTDEQVKAIEEKNTKHGYECVIRLVASGPNLREAKNQLVNLRSAFAQFATTDNNALMKTKWHSNSALVRNFILRTLWRNWTQRIGNGIMILSSDELASLFHLPNSMFNRSHALAWQKFKLSPAPDNLPSEGILLGHNIYRGVKREIRMKREDRFRHFYVIGQTGTGKSSILQSMIRQDLRNGDGLCVIDPHGSLIEDILPFVPRERADDVIYFNPGDMDRPMGLNLLEADTDEERDMVALDAMNIMIKLFDEEVFGPRIQDYFRNGVLTLMDQPEGGSLTDIVRLFTDDDFQKYKMTNVKNPIVKSFWIHQMAKTGAREKQEMIPYFAAKFGAFVTNTMMRNIIGQTKSAFDFFKVMQEKKILLMNLSKGDTGEINSRLLGLIIVSKLQMAAMKRQKIAKEERQDFFLYIDEFQNYITESIESILSEARKYRLSLNVAHQYLAQLEGDAQKKGGKKVSIKDAIFGNVGTMMSYKIGAQDAEFMAKEMGPVFSEQDLINIDKYKAVMKLSIDTQPSRPFSIVPLNPYTETGDREAAEIIKQLSRLKYGRDREFVSREILRRVGADVPV
ncbi:MAG: type IV secretion system DNA-binding domain-containing protein [Patescibacteria group bacterium]|mgnify:CR=1 FL=1